MELLFLGTGAGVPAKERNVSSVALQLLGERGATWLFDCGEATQHQILHTAIRPRRIEHIFITHLHGDHLFGLPGLLGSRSFQSGETPLTVFGPKGIRAFVETALAVSGTKLRYELNIAEIDEGVIFDDERFSVIAKRLDHGMPSYGFRVVEKDLPGPLLVERLQALGVRPGPIYQEIKQGKTVVLDDGTVIDGREFVGPPQKGRIVAVLGDTRFCEAAIELARDADVVVHEATFAAAEQRLAHDYFHSTTTDAAEVARRAGAKRLILTHISSRYQGEAALQLVAEARSVFPNTELAVDFASFSIPRG
ncbi:ribonuclease Z [Geobacillus sp. FSL K6-0789]|uniref:Ribonuclease Z n=2 Tax=Geobacillus stearothermophilus TaxID=1422 RepID=A0A0K9HDC6_GEOSE|nr:MULTISPECIES: ribonuclease Z [Geobacillus]KAF6509890.1 Ribonuclease Z [Geobacillus stearothermophilus]KMY56955.1 ribonuclease Z [Geobacillus stearothermophilus]KMY57218.1 ribonuclease Z [Geobacillus stearothermophilus]KMY57263.1 ribonuclease Z [Geobacillus stearothermophilus]KOR93804.1 ribonuclease Z [Geobacillus stearothermophilus ATCC 12980]